MKRFLHTLPLLLCGWLLAVGTALAQTPVAAYDFNGNALDISGNYNDIAVHGATLTQDRFGWANRAFDFDGVQAYLEAKNSASLNTLYSTVSFWIKPTEIPAQGEVYLISYGGWQERYKISLPNHGKLVWTTNSSTGISDMDAGAGHELVAGVWTHVVFTHDGTDDKIYINGVQVASKPVAGTLNNTTKPLGIGYNPIDGGNFFHGALDDIVILDQALNAAQVAALYAMQNTPPVVLQGLVASYKFSGNTLDDSGYGNTAAPTDVTPATDRFGFGKSAYAFNGTSSEITAANSGQLNSDYTTVSMWVKPNSIPATGEVFLLSFGGWQERIKISLPNHGKVVWTTNGTGGISDMDAGGGNELQKGKWAHLVFTHDGTNDKIFLNGVQVAIKAVSGTLSSTTKPLGIGYNAVDGGNWFDGVIDDVEIYNYALSNAEVATLHTTESTFPGTNDDLVADYAFSGNYEDDSQFGNDAYGRAESTKDRFGWASSAMHFDGTDSLVAPNSAALMSDFTTISFWVKPDELPASGEVFLLSNGGWQERWKASLPSHGKVVFTTNATSGISDMDAGNGNELVVGQWKHVVLVHDGTQDKIYVNGVLANSKNVSGALNDTGHPLGIGFNPIDGGNNFKGSLDEIQVYNRALSAAEIAALYAAQNMAPNITDKLVANYTFDGNADDQTPYHNNAEVEGAQLSNDRFDRANHAYHFDGVDDYVEAENSPQLISNYATVSFWVKPDELPASGEVFLISLGGWQERFKVSLPNHGKAVWTTNGTSSISDMDAGTGNELVVGVWKHLVFTHDGTSDKIYIDGVPVATKGVTGTLNGTTKPLGIGYNPIDVANYFHGSIDEVQLYNVALNDAEIAALYAAQSTPPAVTDVEAPSAPLNLAGEVSFNNVTLSWWPSTDNVAVTGYNVYQDDQKIATTTETSIYLPNLTALTTFTFGVSAVDAEGNESTITTVDVTTDEEETPDVTPPTQPGNLTGSTGAHSVLLSWDASTDDRILKGYVVLVDGVLFDTVGANATSVLVNGLDAETPYTFEVYAFDKAGNNSTHAEVTLTTDEEINTGEPGLVAYYPFEGNANDATPYANHGVIGGNPVFEPAAHPNGGAQNIKFDGVGDSIIAPNAVQLISDYTTVAFWIRADAIPVDAESYVLDFGHWSERWKISLPQHLKIVWTTNGNNIQFPNFISDMDSKDGNEMTLGFWWYVTMVHDGVNDKIYVNGEEVNSQPVPTKLNSTGRPLGMGNNPIEGGQYFNGGLDELKIYNKALTAGEIENLYQTGTSGVKDELSADLLRFIRNVYPNPATDRLWVQHSFDGKQSLLLRVTDLQGRQIDALSFEKGETPAGQFSLDVHAYPAGTYLMNVVLGGKTLGSVKFEKQ